MEKIFIVPDVHCRNFYKPVLNIKDSPVIFLGDYMDPYGYEGFSDENGIVNLEEIVDFAKNNDNVTLLVGNHDASYIWNYLGIERTYYKFYNDLHKFYRDNIDVFHIAKKVGNTLFTHAGVNFDWLKWVNQDNNINEDDIIEYLTYEFNKMLESDKLQSNYVNKSKLFGVGYSRWGDIPYGTPTWSDFNVDYYDPDWNLKQIFGHTQGEITGQIRTKGKGACLDSRAIFEYYPEIGLIKTSEINLNSIGATLDSKHI